MSEQDVIDQLSRYGAWLEAEVRLPLKGDAWSRFDALIVFDGSDEADTDLIKPIEPIEILAPALSEHVDSLPGSVEEVRSLGARLPRRARVLVGTSVLLLVAVLGGLWLNGQPSSLTTADLPPDPPGTLFVLPDPAQELKLSGDWTDKSDSPWPAPSRVYVFATTDDQVFQHPVTVWVSEGEPESMTRKGVTEHAASGGPAFVSEFGPVQHLVQQRDEFFLSLTSLMLATDELLEMLGELEMDGIGRLTLSDNSELALMDSFDLDPRFARIRTSAFDAIGELDGTVTIQTGNGPSGAMSAGHAGGQWSSWEQGGRFGWEVRGAFENLDEAPGHDGEEAPSNAVVWQATPNWVVFAGGQASIEELHRIVDGLRIVTEDEWHEAFKG